MGCHRDNRSFRITVLILRCLHRHPTMERQGCRYSRMMAMHAIPAFSRYILVPAASITSRRRQLGQQIAQSFISQNQPRPTNSAAAEQFELRPIQWIMLGNAARPTAAVGEPGEKAVLKSRLMASRSAPVIETSCFHSAPMIARSLSTQPRPEPATKVLGFANGDRYCTLQPIATILKFNGALHRRHQELLCEWDI